MRASWRKSSGRELWFPSLSFLVHGPTGLHWPRTTRTHKDSAFLEYLDTFLSGYGYWVFFAVGFAEFAGVPIVSVPVLIGGGALVASGTLGFWAVVVSVAAGGWFADLGWYSIGRRRGAWLIDAACGLSSNPRACVFGVKSQLSRMGTRYILLAKMLPGSGNLIAVAAGLAGFGLFRFILANAASLILWASIYTGTGWILADHVTTAIEWALTYNSAVLVVVLLLVALAAAWRIWKVRVHQEGHRRMETVASRLSRGEPASVRTPSPDGSSV